MSPTNTFHMALSRPAYDALHGTPLWDPLSEDQLRHAALTMHPHIARPGNALGGVTDTADFFEAGEEGMGEGFIEDNGLGRPLVVLRSGEVHTVQAKTDDGHKFDLQIKGNVGGNGWSGGEQKLALEAKRDFFCWLMPRLDILAKELGLDDSTKAAVLRQVMKQMGEHMDTANAALAEIDETAPQVRLMAKSLIDEFGFEGVSDKTAWKGSLQAKEGGVWVVSNGVQGIYVKGDTILARVDTLPGKGVVLFPRGAISPESAKDVEFRITDPGTEGRVQFMQISPDDPSHVRGLTRVVSDAAATTKSRVVEATKQPEQPSGWTRLRGILGV